MAPTLVAGQDDALGIETGGSTLPTSDVGWGQAGVGTPKGTSAF